ncbi:MAG: glutamate ABC transporter substrate-binding protein [Nocardiaceae bacterium]|nr:glutamate ABC transporter substrate-binding protein [Nocardiaceae bacterium]
MRIKRLAFNIALIAVVAGLGACSESPQPPPQASAPSTTAPATADTSCGDPTASLRPPDQLPAPGNMPEGSFMATIAARGRVVVGTSQDTLLFSSRNPFTGSIEGFDIDVARLIAQAVLGDPNKIQIVVIPNSDRIKDVQNGTVDLVAETMTINCQRRAAIDFSTVYYQAGQKVLVPTTSSATSLDDLGGKTVCAVAGSTSINAIVTSPAHPKLLTEPTWGECLVAFQQNRADAISTDDTILAGLAAQDPYAKVVGPRFTDEPYGLGISQAHPEFTRFVNGVLAQARAAGTLEQIADRWLGRYSAPAPLPDARYRD